MFQKKQSIKRLERVLDQQMLDSIIKAVFGISLVLCVITLPKGHTTYAALNIAVALGCIALWYLNKIGYFKQAFWIGTIALSITMVLYTYFFGFINAHMYLLAGIIILSYFTRKTRYISEALWVVGGALFILSYYFLRSNGHINQLDGLEQNLFYPNLILSLLLLYMGARLYRKKQEKQREQLENSLLVKDKLLAVLSHDLRTPFHSLKSIVGLIKSESLTKEEIKISLDGIDNNINQSFEMLENVLLWVSSQQREIQPVKEVIDLNEVLQRITHIFKNSAEQKGVSIRFEPNPTAIPVKTDKDMLETVIRNLLSNAIKFSPSNSGKVSLSIDLSQPKIAAVSIKDNGPGMTDEQVNKLFNNATTSKGSNNEKSFGIGLQLVSIFCNELGIKLSVESKIKNGSTFILDVPKSILS